MKRKLLQSAILLMIILPMTFLTAQEGRGKGRLVGEVKDEAGQPLPGVKMNLKSLKFDFQLDTLSDENGKWSFFGFAGGDFDIMAEKEGYIPMTLRTHLSGLQANPNQSIVLKKPKEEDLAPIDPKAVPPDHLKWIKDAEAQQKAGQYAEAVATYRKFLTAHPIHYKYQVNVGNCLLEMKDYQAAITAFEEALKGLKAEKQDKLAGDKLAADLYSNIGTAWLKLGDQAKAAENYKLSAKILPPTDAALAYNVAEIVMAGGDAAAAIEYYNLAIQINPKDPIYYEKRGYAYLNSGDIAKALESFNEFIKMAPDHPRAGEVKEMIKALQ